MKKSRDDETAVMLRVISAVIALGLVARAAQTALPQPPRGAPPAVRLKVPDYSPASTRGGIEQVVVTAERRASTVQRTPIAIQTISGSTIQQAGVTDAQDLDRLVPGLIVNNAGPGASSFQIRGLGTSNVASFADSSVAFGLDQVYFSRSYGPDLTLYDLARVEVLKGPQDTLYGRNATGGAINVISNNPAPDFGGYAGVEIGNYGEYKFDGAVNVPLSNQLSTRVAFQTVNHNGYDNAGYDNQDNQAARVKTQWKPSEDVSVLLLANYMHDGSKGPTATPYDNNNFTLGPRDGSGTEAGVAYRSRTP